MRIKWGQGEVGTLVRMEESLHRVTTVLGCYPSLDYI